MYSRERHVHGEISGVNGSSRSRDSTLHPEKICRWEPPPSAPHARHVFARHTHSRTAPAALPIPLPRCRSPAAPAPPLRHPHRPVPTPPPPLPLPPLAPPPSPPPWLPAPAAPHGALPAATDSDVQGAWRGDRGRGGWGGIDGGGAGWGEGRKAGSGGRKRLRGAEERPPRHSTRTWGPLRDTGRRLWRHLWQPLSNAGWLIYATRLIWPGRSQAGLGCATWPEPCDDVGLPACPENGKDCSMEWSGNSQSLFFLWTRPVVAGRKYVSAPWCFKQADGSTVRARSVQSSCPQPVQMVALYSYASLARFSRHSLDFFFLRAMWGDQWLRASCLEWERS